MFKKRMDISKVTVASIIGLMVLFIVSGFSFARFYRTNYPGGGFEYGYGYGFQNGAGYGYGYYANDDDNGEYGFFGTDGSVGNVTSSVSENNGVCSITVNFDTTYIAQHYAEYGTTLGLGQSTFDAPPLSPIGNNNVLISDLECDTTYYYRIVTRDAGGNLWYTSTQSVTTPVIISQQSSRRGTTGGFSAAVLQQNKQATIASLLQQIQLIQNLLNQLRAQQLNNGDSVLVCTPPLRLGSRGAQVQLLQSKLNIGSDGIFGSQTDRAVRNFQQQNNLTVDGIAGSQTCSRL